MSVRRFTVYARASILHFYAHFAFSLFVLCVRFHNKCIYLRPWLNISLRFGRPIADIVRYLLTYFTYLINGGDSRAERLAISHAMERILTTLMSCRQEDETDHQRRQLIRHHVTAESR